MSTNKPKKTELRGNDTHVKHGTNIVPRYETYVVTDNKTTENGCVINKSEEDAEFCRDAVNMNKK